VLGTNSNTNTGGSFDCTFPDGPASPSVSVYAEDDDAPGNGNPGNTESLAVTVNNVKPTPTINPVAGTGGAACTGGNTVTLGFSWVDPALTNDTYSYDVNWGDASAHTIAGLGATSPVSGLTHSYAAGGPYTIIVTVNDDDADAGNTDSSAPFSFLYDTSGILQPINLTGTRSSFKIGSTIPVKVRVFDCNNVSVAGLTLNVSLIKLDGSALPANETVVSSVPDSGTVMRYSAASDPLYIYNLSTKRSQLCSSQAPCTSGGDLTAGTYLLTILGPIEATFAYIDLRL
ncbi:MAG TPA: PxKF domain-containing protein, partial [Candidatus Eisenbacteria bacterium]|nr:PxKF domain-containing protein [Candidatus Eisenbacteria bacterium]